MLHAFTSKLARDLRAGCFIGTGAVENDLRRFFEFVQDVFNVVDLKMHGAGNHVGVAFEIKWAAKIHDYHFFARVHFLF